MDAAKSVSTENAVSRQEGADQIRTGVRDRSTVPAGTSPFEALHRTRRTAEVLLASKRHASVALSAAGRDLIRDHERLIAVAEEAREYVGDDEESERLLAALARLDFGDGA